MATSHTRVTRQQHAVVRAVGKEAPLLVVNALAGTGKTQTLLAAAQALPRCRILYVAFNKAKP